MTSLFPKLEGKTLLFLVSEDWYFCSHRLPIARAARDAGMKVAVACRVRKHGEAIRNEGFALYPIRLNRSGRNPFADIGSILALRKLYRRVRPDIVHQVAVKPVLYGSVAAWLAGVPHVVNAMAGLGFVFISKGAFATLVRPALAAAFRILLNRRNTRLILQNGDDSALFQSRIGVSSDRIAIIRGSGVDTNTFTPSPEPAGPITVSCVSRMLWDKGIGELVDAARLLRRSGKDIVVRLIGPTDDNPASIPQEMLDAWRAEGIVDIAGPTTDVAAVYAGSHIAVLPSYREGLPKSLLEAAACGLPMVATDVPGCREVCRNGETGILVPVREAEPLAAALERLAEDEALRKTYGIAARRAAEEEFAEPVITEQTLVLYEAILDDEK
ncbi:glycosyltransferase family 4 protein [Hwanghaeella sp.]|uniref:glycosyltransferase family 4 protein n=1 Tax=Hwanghaeella sp. TaxID=2605943 RepID=UPI003CCBF2B6